jgi:cyclic dehypoxanthinyl futalosine synthase
VRLLRVANVDHVSALPYRALAEYETVHYEENSAFENGRRLSEGEVDLALISVAEFATHGGYVGLDFGVGCRNRSDTIMLYSGVPLEEISRVNVYASASSSLLLFRLLASQRWGISPGLVRRPERDLRGFVRGREAALILHPARCETNSGFLVSEDLVKQWCEWTNHPFVSLIWAVRPGALSADHLQFLNDLFHRAVQNRGALASRYASHFNLPEQECYEYVTNVREYYFDEFVLSGLRELFARSARAGLLPEASYANATVQLIASKVPNRQPAPSPQALLQRVMSGARLGVKEAVRLSYEASTADLAVASDVVRRRVRGPATCLPVIQLGEPPSELSSEGAISWLAAQVQASCHDGCRVVRLPMLGRFVADLAWWEHLMKELRAAGAAQIEGCPPFEVRWISALCGTPIEAVARRLVAAGLTTISGDGGELLVDRAHDAEGRGFLQVEDWLQAIKWGHSNGGRSCAVIRVHPFDSWEDRILHLQKLRSLQDETPGFSGLIVQNLVAWKKCGGIETRMRLIFLARLFLDNILSIQQEESLGDWSLPGLMGLGAGIDTLRVMIPSGSRSAMTLADMRRSLLAMTAAFGPIGIPLRGTTRSSPLSSRDEAP